MYHYYGIIHSISTPLKILCFHLFISPIALSPLTSGNHWFFYCLQSVGIIQYVVFSDWLLSLGNRHLSFLHVFSCLDNSFFWCWIISHHLRVSRFIYSPIEGYLDCFQVLAIISAAAISIHLLVFVWRQVFNSFGSYKKNIFNIVWNCRTVFFFFFFFF